MSGKSRIQSRLDSWDKKEGLNTKGGRAARHNQHHHHHHHHNNNHENKSDKDGRRDAGDKAQIRKRATGIDRSGMG